MQLNFRAQIKIKLYLNKIRLTKTDIEAQKEPNMTRSNAD